ncbi:MAG: hypothetical protein DLM67_19385 [Candidatus Nephthysia bennettiae]|nr:MAG: hypothetical protein DLM67_19385 [Candidatus Dormibacteraeota bacterium]
MLRHSVIASVVALGLAAGLNGAVEVSLAHADTASVSPGMPTQSMLDQSASDPNSFGPGWADVPGGVAARPYVVSLTVINGDVSTPVITNGTPTSAPVPAGDVTTAVSALNLCRPGQTPARGTCYATPNLVGLTVGYGENGGGFAGMDFSNPDVPVTPTIDANSVIDMTVSMNTLGKSLRSTWVNGDLLYWQTTSLGQGDATVHIKFRPATAPFVRNFPDSNGCTASPPFNCAIARADYQRLTAQIVFGLDDSGDPALTGAVFATQNAITGVMTPGGSGQAPSLDVRLSSTHLQADGTPELGTIEAFIPAAALLNFYGVLPTDSTRAFTTTRGGDPGTNEPPSYKPWTAAANGSDGLLITVKGITFSVPNYHLSSRLKPVAVHAKARGSKTTITASISGCDKKRKCLATVYDLGRNRARRFVASKTAVLSNKLITTGTLSLTGPASKLKKGDRYLLVVRSAKHKKVLASSIGTVG